MSAPEDSYKIQKVIERLIAGSDTSVNEASASSLASIELIGKLYKGDGLPSGLAAVAKSECHMYEVAANAIQNSPALQQRFPLNWQGTVAVKSILQNYLDQKKYESILGDIPAVKAELTTSAAKAGVSAIGASQTTP